MCKFFPLVLIQLYTFYPVLSSFVKIYPYLAMINDDDDYTANADKKYNHNIDNHHKKYIHIYIYIFFFFFF